MQPHTTILFNRHSFLMVHKAVYVYACLFCAICSEYHWLHVMIPGIEQACDAHLQRGKVFGNGPQRGVQAGQEGLLFDVNYLHGKFGSGTPTKAH